MVQLVQWINKLIEEDKLWKFYKSKQWIQLKTEVLEEHHHECYICRQQGKITRANTVHHVNYVREKPQLALSKYYIDNNGNKQLNLIPICKACHNKVHYKDKLGKLHEDKFTNEERW